MIIKKLSQQIKEQLVDCDFHDIYHFNGAVYHSISIY